jgi:hypothetical protein
MRPGTPFTDGNNVYDYGDLALAIDVEGPQVELSECSAARVRGQFKRGDPVLLGNSQASPRPIRILFAHPVRAVGAFIGAEGLAGAAYRASLTVPDAAGGPDCGLRVDKTLSLAANSAPFLGMQCDQGELIREVWFKASSAGGMPRVAISHLYYLPA